MIDLDKKHLETVARILAEQTPECEAWAFGSRVEGTAKKYSDLDLAVFGRFDAKKLEELRLAFSESDLPMTVDVVDFNAVSENFKEIIRRRHEVIQTPADSKGKK